jgi:hypothetical protein
MALDKGKLKEKLSALSVEDRGLFRETLLEIEPPQDTEIFTSEEIAALREILTLTKEKSAKRKKDGGGILESLFGG